MSTNPPDFIDHVMAHSQQTLALDRRLDEQSLVALGMLEADATATAPEAPLIEARRVAVLACDGVDGSQLSTVQQALEAAGARVHIVSSRSGFLKGADGHAQIKVDHDWLDMPSVMFDAVYIPGGIESLASLSANEDALYFVQEAYEHGKAMAASDEGVDLLRHLGVSVPEHDQGVETIPGVVTSGPRAHGLDRMNERFIEAIAKDRHWRRTESIDLPQQ